MVCQFSALKFRKFIGLLNLGVQIFAKLVRTLNFNTKVCTLNRIIKASGLVLTYGAHATSQYANYMEA